MHFPKFWHSLSLRDKITRECTKRDTFSRIVAIVSDKPEELYRRIVII